MFSRIRTHLIPCLILALVLISCGEASTTGTPASPVPQTPTHAAAATPTPTPARTTHFMVGQSAQVGSDWLVTVSKVTKSAGSEFIKPKAGDRFVVVTVSLKNTSTQEQDFSSLLQFTMRDANGFTYTETYLDTTRPSPNGKVEAQGLLSGDLVYEVPESMGRFTLAFVPGPLANAQTIWDITV